MVSKPLKNRESGFEAKKREFFGGMGSLIINAYGSCFMQACATTQNTIIAINALVKYLPKKISV